MARDKEQKMKTNRHGLWKGLLKAAVVIAVLRTAGRLYAEYSAKKEREEENANENSAYKNYSVVMKGREINIEEKFAGAKIKAVLSGVSLNLQNAQIDTDVVLNISNVLGGVDICVPEGVNVSCKDSIVLGGVANSVPEYEGEQVHTIYLESRTVLGGINIRAAKSEDGVVRDYFEENTFQNISEEVTL